MTRPPIPYQAIVESSISPFVLVDGQGYVLWAGPAIEVLLGRPADSYVGVHFLDVLHPSSHEPAIAAFREFARPARASQAWVGPPMLLDLIGANGPVACEISAASGASLGIEGALLHVRRWRGTVLLYQAVDAIAAGAPLDEILSHLLELAEHDMPQSGVAIGLQWTGSHFGRVVGAPEPAALLQHEGRGTPWHTALTTDRIVGEADLTGLPEELAAAAGADGYRSCWAIPVTIRPDIAPTAALVAWRRIEGRAAPHLTTTALRVSRLVALSLEGERTRATWQRAARTDPLTGLSNRAELDEWLAWVTTLASDRPVAALFCDLDDFKPINERYGHAAGDEVLGAVAARIRGTVRPSDVVVRWGGDEFVVLCAEPTSADDASGIARRVIEEVNHPIAVGEAQVRLGVSVGVATALAGMSHQLVGQADRALQQAKAAGKNQWRLLAAAPTTP